VGEPLGFYGDSGNVSRFLCVREDLRLLVAQDEQRKKKILESLSLQQKVGANLE